MLRRRIRLHIVVIILGILCGTLLLSHCQAKQEERAQQAIQKNIAANIVRFHVLANSDSTQDQALKLKVRDAVLDTLRDELTSCTDLKSAKKIITANQDNILRVAGNTIKKAGYDYSVTGYFTDCYFPEKTYGDATFPAGTYHAYRIQIGEAKGKNWWCVMYPPLCFVDASHGVLPDASKEQLKSTLDADSYDEIFEDESTQIRFKYLTFLNDWFS